MMSYLKAASCCADAYVPLGAVWHRSITTVSVPAAARAVVLRTCLGPLYPLFMERLEQLFNAWLPDLRDRPWIAYALSNGGYYLAPIALRGNATTWCASRQAKQRRVAVTAIAACMVACDQLSFHEDGTRAAELYFVLRDFIEQLPVDVRSQVRARACLMAGVG